LKYFLQQESTIDARFDDFLALLQTGSDGGVKMEIASNYWDEMGNGDLDKMHTAMFVRTLESLGLQPGDGDLAVEALACGNLALLLSLRRKHFYKAIGYFAATEFLTPSRFTHVLSAWRRHGLPPDAAEYHTAHISIDARHAYNWLANVISPVVDRIPNAGEDIARGTWYRLNTSQRYLDMLLFHFTRQTSVRS
jgi:hypothetical protein